MHNFRPGKSQNGANFDLTVLTKVHYHGARLLLKCKYFYFVTLQRFINLRAVWKIKSRVNNVNVSVGILFYTQYT